MYDAPMPVSDRNSAELRVASSGSRRVVILTLALTAIAIAILWVVAARRQTRDDVFEPVRPVKTSSGTATHDGPDVGRRNNREPPIWDKRDAIVSTLRLSPDDRYLAAIVGQGDGEHFEMRVLLIERRTGTVLVDTPGYFRVRTCFTPVSDALVVYTPDTYPFTHETRQLIREMAKRFQRRAGRADIDSLWTATYVLMGLQYEEGFASQLLQGVRSMEESVTYQAILKKGRVEEARRMLLAQGTKQFGKPSVRVRKTIEAIAEPMEFERLSMRLLDVKSWADLLAEL
jgi:hypothetical protein